MASTMFYTRNDIFKAIMKMFDNHWEAVSIMFQHYVLSNLFELRQTYEELQSSLILFLANQQQKHSRKSSLIAHQLCTWMRWRQKAHMLRCSLFSCATLSILLEHDVSKHTSQVWLMKYILQRVRYSTKLNPLIHPYLDRMSLERLLREVKDFISRSLRAVPTAFELLSKTFQDLLSSMKGIAFHFYQMALSSNEIAGVKNRRLMVGVSSRDRAAYHIKNYLDNSSN